MWEYSTVNFSRRLSGGQLESAFNKKGAEGWELVACTDHYAIFKRPIR